MIRVAVIEDYPDYRKGLSYLINASEGFKCVGVYEESETAIQSMTGIEDVLLLDINLPGISGVEALPLLKTKFPELRILMLTVLEDDQTIMEAILSGADGYLLKKSQPERILSSLKETFEGGSPMTPAIAKRVLNLFKKFVPTQKEDFLLTQRENEILLLMVDGLNNQHIAQKLFISFQTVRNHVRHIYDKLHVHSKSQAVVKAIREGLV